MKIKNKVNWFFKIGLSAAVFTLSVFIFSAAAAAISPQGSGTATTDQALYLDPSDKNPVSSYTKSYISKNDSFDIYWRENGWYFIGYHGSTFKRGYVPATSVSTKSKITENTYTSWWTKTNGTSQNTYLCPETLVKTGSVNSTDNIQVIGEESSYYYIQYPISSGTKRGFIPKNVLITGNADISVSVFNLPTGNVSDGSYVVSVKVSGGTKGISSVKFPTWTLKDGQDDIKWGNGTTMGNNVWSYTVNTHDHNDENGSYQTHVYVYDAAGNVKVIGLPVINVGTTQHSYITTQYGTSASGQKLIYYTIQPQKITSSTKKLFLNFEIHGWEDGYAQDGQVLTDIANSVSDYFSAHSDALKNCIIYVVPRCNPDGLFFGYTNNGPGRCQTSLGIDLNRDFDFSFITYTKDRNKTLSQPFSAPESRYLSSLVSTLKPNIVMDFHGWLDETIGDNNLSAIINKTIGMPWHGEFTSTQHGFFAAWAQKYAQQTALVEYPQSCAEGDKELYTQKTINALTSIISSCSVNDIPPVITINPYDTKPTNKDITVTAVTDKGTLNANSHTFTENGSFTFTARDQDGNETSKTVTVTNIDKTPPTAPVIKMTGNYILRIISGADGESGIDHVLYSINGSAFISFKQPIQLRPGSYIITAVNTDKAGNQSTSTLRMIKKVHVISK